MQSVGKGKKWEWLHSLWLLWIPTSLTFVAFFFLGIKAKQRNWIVFGLAYLAPFLALIRTVGQSNQGTPPGNFEVAITLIWLASWIVSSVHLIRLRKQYLQIISGNISDGTKKKASLKIPRWAMVGLACCAGLVPALFYRAEILPAFQDALHAAFKGILYLGIGLFSIGILVAPKKDGRFRTGYKGNASGDFSGTLFISGLGCIGIYALSAYYFWLATTIFLPALAFLIIGAISAIREKLSHQNVSGKERDSADNLRFKRTTKSSDENSTVQDRNVAEQKSPFEILGVSEKDSLDDVKRAYHKLISQYHPDKVASLAPEFQKLANEKAREINDAYGKVTNRREAA